MNFFLRIAFIAALDFLAINTAIAGTIIERLRQTNVINIGYR
jgi:hypothetical protein